MVFIFKVYVVLRMEFVYRISMCVLQVLFVGSQCALMHPRFPGLSEPEAGQNSGGWFTACVFLLMSSARMCSLHNDYYQRESVVLI